MEFVLQLVVNGFLLGGVYAITAMTLAMVYKSTAVFNFAVGEIMTIGMFTAYSLMVIGIPAWGSIIIAVLLTAALGWLIDRTTMRPLIGQPIITSVMATFGLFFILKGAQLLIWQLLPTSYPQDLPGAHLQIGSITMGKELLWIFAIAVVIGVFVFILFQYTKVGLEMKATAENQQLARARGVRVGWIFSITWMLSAGVCGLAGIFVAYRLGVVPDVASVGLAAFPAVLLGGLESIPGAVVGGLTMGLTISLTSGLIDPMVSVIAPFVIMLVILIIRPEGILGLKRIERI